MDRANFKGLETKRNLAAQAIWRTRKKFSTLFQILVKTSGSPSTNKIKTLRNASALTMRINLVIRIRSSNKVSCKTVSQTAISLLGWGRDSTTILLTPRGSTRGPKLESLSTTGLKAETEIQTNLRIEKGALPCQITKAISLGLNQMRS